LIILIEDMSKEINRRKAYRFVKLYHPIGSLVAAVGGGVNVDVGVTGVLSRSRTPSTAKCHNCRPRDGFDLTFSLVIGLLGDENDSRC